jgi:hypothetical protein
VVVDDAVDPHADTARVTAISTIARQ